MIFKGDACRSQEEDLHKGIVKILADRTYSIPDYLSGLIDTLPEDMKEIIELFSKMKSAW